MIIKVIENGTPFVITTQMTYKLFGMEAKNFDGSFKEFVEEMKGKGYIIDYAVPSIEMDWDYRDGLL